jgi:hypothetical protein
MSLSKRTAAMLVAGALTTGTLGALTTGTLGAATMLPAAAVTSDNPVTSRLAHLKEALSGLVSSGTLTQAQADKVATTLDERLPERGRGGPGRGEGLDAAAKALGMSTADLRTALHSGQSLADVAKTKGVSVDDLVAALVTSAKEHLAEQVKEGRITQAQADQRSSELTERITDRVNRVHREHRPGGPAGDGAASSSAGLSTT